MKIALIGVGAIGSWLQERLDPKPVVVRRGDALPMADVVVEVAGHAALAQYGVAALRQGSDLVIASIGALADEALWVSLQQAATRAKILLPAGAVAGIDALAAARLGGLDSVRYSSRKPPASLSNTLPLDRESVVFEGNARDAALQFLKNANVAATIALAGIGFEKTEVRIIADPTLTQNVHVLEASGAFGTFTMNIAGRPLPGNPRSSSLTAMSLLRCIQNRQSSIVL
ncbi:aspartate dehydrogenase [Bradyrhizobium canariense]|uniref:L-aspartate dehydrogenase n=1 Tax=Bradyrhizobium canariense TaxID=255045 RepID=A0A1H2B7A3_9BRAD|nr:aspartate dehydrogenase [Bradyrhizobium canariense]SDT53947.1 aspartate dehydrogenase [Bradyrhizobium canariense]